MPQGGSVNATPGRPVKAGLVRPGGGAKGGPLPGPAHGSRKRVDVAQLVGPAEIAVMLGVDRSTVWQWVGRRRLPEPLAIVSGTRLWDRRAIMAWARATGRA